MKGKGQMKYRFLIEDSCSTEFEDKVAPLGLMVLTDELSKRQGYKKMKKESSDKYMVFEKKNESGAVQKRVVRIVEI